MRTELELIQPDDWHVHLRDGDALQAVVGDSARQFARALVMPNLKPAVVTTVEALSYRARILAALPEGSSFTPLMTLYLTDQTPPQEIAKAKSSAVVVAAKLYPAGATTNSASGVTDVAALAPVFAAMEESGLVLCVHGEVVDREIDVFDREKVFIERHLSRIRREFPALKIVFEHITTREAVDFVREAAGPTAATITAHHLLHHRNALFDGGLRPHYYCLPVLKRVEHQQALIAAATSGDPKFFLGTDSAPHAQNDKTSDCGCAGCYTALHAIELYAQAFDRADALHKLEGFASLYGADFYGLARNTRRMMLRRDPWTVPAALPFPGSALIPLDAGATMDWRLDRVDG